MELVLQLLDLKSSDKKSTLLHYIAQTVQEKFPSLLDFDTELIFTDKATEGKEDGGDPM